jgi:hypothetical protein
MNLNDAVQGNAHDLKKCQILLELGDLVRTYDEAASYPLYVGIGNLTFETSRYRNGRVKLVTRKENTSEIFEIFSEGPSLDAHILERLNSNYVLGVTLHQQPRIEGSKIAAYLLIVFAIELCLSKRFCLSPIILKIRFE